MIFFKFNDKGTLIQFNIDEQVGDSVSESVTSKILSVYNKSSCSLQEHSDNTIGAPSEAP